METTKEQIQKRLKKLGLSQRKLSIKFRRSDSQITQAMHGSQPGLKKKILNYLDKLELEKQLNNN